MRIRVRAIVVFWVFVIGCIATVNTTVLASGVISKSGVFDQAGLFTSAQSSDLEKRTEDFANRYKMSIIVATTDYTGGKSTVEYADDFVMDQGFYELGDKGTLLLLIDMDNREVYISTSGGAEYYLNDPRIDDTIDAGYDSLADGRYYRCVEQMIGQVEYYVEQGIPSDQYFYDEETGKISVYRHLTVMEIGLAVLVAAIVALVVCISVIGKYRLKWGTYKYPYREKSSLQLTREHDRFVNQIVTTRRIPRNPPPSGGRGGGGNVSSMHRSSGGGNFGGGGRRF